MDSFLNNVLYVQIFTNKQRCVLTTVGLHTVKLNMYNPIYYKYNKIHVNSRKINLNRGVVQNLIYWYWGYCINPSRQNESIC